MVSFCSSNQHHNAADSIIEIGGNYTVAGPEEIGRKYLWWINSLSSVEDQFYQDRMYCKQYEIEIHIWVMLFIYLLIKMLYLYYCCTQVWLSCYHCCPYWQISNPNLNPNMWRILLSFSKHSLEMISSHLLR